MTLNRVKAELIDILIYYVGFYCVPVMFIFLPILKISVDKANENNDQLSYGPALPFLLGGYLFVSFVIANSIQLYKSGQSFGYKFAKLKIVYEDDKVLTKKDAFKRALARMFVLITLPSIIIPIIYMFIVVSNDGKRSPLDLLFKTKAVEV